MEFEELDLPGVWLAKSPTYRDSRGLFREWFQASDFQNASGIEFVTSQSNCSTSVENVIRGIHFSRSPIGQAKFVTCVQGSILDVVIAGPLIRRITASSTISPLLPRTTILRWRSWLCHWLSTKL